MFVSHALAWKYIRKVSIKNVVFKKNSKKYLESRKCFFLNNVLRQTNVCATKQISVMFQKLGLIIKDTGHYYSWKVLKAQPPPHRYDPHSRQKPFQQINKIIYNQRCMQPLKIWRHPACELKQKPATNVGFMKQQWEWYCVSGVWQWKQPPQPTSFHVLLISTASRKHSDSLQTQSAAARTSRDT